MSVRKLYVALLAAAAVLLGVIVSAPPGDAASPVAETLFGSTVPTVKADTDPAKVELGVQFRTAVAGSITGVRFYKGTGNTGTHTGSIWAGATLMRTSVFHGETGSGWQSLTFGSPLPVAAGSSFTASYLAPRGHYAVDNPYTFPHTSGDLTAVKGTYKYGGGDPTSVYQVSNYWVDVSFTPSVAPPTTTPSTSSSSSSSTTPVTTTPVSTTPVTTTTASAGCAAAGNVPDGPDPWGGCWAGPTTTGVPAGTSLTNYTGPATITTDGTIIDSKRVTACLNIAANNVTIRNSLLQSNGCFFNVLNNSGGTGLQLTDVEIDGQGNTTGDSSIAGDDYTCLRCNIHGTSDGAKGGTNVAFQDSYIHDLAVTSTSHNDGIQTLDTTSLVFRHNTIISPGRSTSAMILSTGASTNMRNVVMNRNLVGGGAYTIYGGYQAGADDLSKVSNISITENRFTTVIYPQSGAFGPLTSVDPPAVSHSGNVWADGPNVGVDLD